MNFRFISVQLRVQAIALLVAHVLFLACFSHALVAAPSKMAKEDFSSYYDLVYQIRVVSPQAASKSSIGSGFQVSADGLLITNYHVVSSYVQHPDTHHIEYQSFHGDQGRLELLNFDVINDLAVLRLDKARPSFFEFSDEQMSKGQVVYALGNPRDYGVTMVPGPNNGMVEHSYNEQILFSGSLNPGMSGGPAVDEFGQVVGVNVATAGAALSFLIPVNKVKKLVQSPQKLTSDGYSDAISAQVKAWQRDRIQPLIDTDWSPETFADEALFGELRSDFQCWGDTNEDSKRRAVDWVSKSCRSANYIYLDGSLSTGQINYSFEKRALIKLSSTQFLASIESGMGADNASNFDHSTNYQCRNDFINRDTASGYRRVTTCVRAYKRLQGLYDSLLLVERISGESSLVTHLSIAGAEKDQIVALNKKFVEASTNE